MEKKHRSSIHCCSFYDTSSQDSEGPSGWVGYVVFYLAIVKLKGDSSVQ